MQSIIEGITEFIFEVQAFWDDKQNENIRVIGCINDGGLRAFFPLTDSFIKSPRNDFVNE